MVQVCTQNRPIGRDRESAAIVRAVTTLADALGVPVTVEGIENAETLAAVAGFGRVVGFVGAGGLVNPPRPSALSGCSWYRTSKPSSPRK